MAESAQLIVSIGTKHTDTSQATERLLNDLAREGVPVSRPRTAAPTGSKSGIVFEAGSLIISGALSTVVIRSITQIVLAYIRRGVAGEITLSLRGKKLTINNASRETERALTAWLAGDGTNTEQDKS